MRVERLWEPLKGEDKGLVRIFTPTSLLTYTKQSVIIQQTHLKGKSF